MIMSGRSVNLTTLFLDRLRPPKRLTSISCIYFHQKPTTALLESVEGEMKVCGRTEYRTRDLWLMSQTNYRLCYSSAGVNKIFLEYAKEYIGCGLNDHKYVLTLMHSEKAKIVYNFGLSESNRVKK